MVETLPIISRNTGDFLRMNNFSQIVCEFLLRRKCKQAAFPVRGNSLENVKLGKQILCVEATAPGDRSWAAGGEQGARYA